MALTAAYLETLREDAASDNWGTRRSQNYGCISGHLRFRPRAAQLSFALDFGKSNCKGTPGHGEV